MKLFSTSKLLLSFLPLLLVAETFAAPIFTPDSQPTGWLARPDTTSYDLSNGNQVFFQVDYNPDSWSGDIRANHINNQALVQPTGPWDVNNPTLATAASLLGSLHYSTGRKIVTLKDNGNKIAFRWANLSGAQQSSIDGNSTTGNNILNFVRGQRSKEVSNGGSFRNRVQIMGDAIHATPYFWKHNATTKRIYAGTNDGMLHVFNADTGAEMFAYIPSMLISKLKKLTADPYLHTHFVDGPISIANVNISGNKTILVGALGAGGEGLYALDITNPTPVSEADAASKILWEISSASGSFSNLGYTFGTPKIARLNDGTAVVIVGNGYVNSGDGNGNGHAILYIINLATGALIKEIDTGSGTAGSPNGLSTPTLADTNGDGKVDYAYAGDIDGKLWKFNLSSNTPSTYSSSLLFTTSPAQAITVAPVLHTHPYGGTMVAFATGRILTSGDEADNAVHYAYGIWDGAPVANDQLLTQTLSTASFGSLSIRTITANPPDWTDGSGHHKGWKVALPAGERTVGEAPFYNNQRFYFLSTNPTVTNTPPPDGANWLNELNMITGGSPTGPILDLNLDGNFNSSDLADNNSSSSLTPCEPETNSFTSTYITCIPVSKYLGSGVFSQPLLVNAYGFITTLYAFHPDMPTDNGNIIDPPDPGISGGHFDFDIYYYDGSNFKKKKHKHQYDDTYGVTGVNMLNASEPAFNLPNAISSTSTKFKVLVINQYLNPAAKLSVGGANYESVKTYGNMASETNATTLLAGLPIYTRTNLDTLIFNLPLDAFKSKDWWGDGGTIRAGLMPTQTGCVNDVDSAGRSRDPGPNGERANGALVIQIIKFNTPGSALVLNRNTNGGLSTSERVKYGWTVKASKFTSYVLAEYTTFWHHKENGNCYGENGWVPDPPEVLPDEDADIPTPPAGTADPIDGAFSGGLAISSTATTVNGGTTTTVTTYSDNSTYTKIEAINNDGTVTITQIYQDGTTEVTTVVGSSGTAASYIDPSKGSPKEESTSGETGRQSWRELTN